MELILALCVQEPLAFSLNPSVQRGNYNLPVYNRSSVNPFIVGYSLPVALPLCSVNLAWVTL
jgi:hypothetical protein